MPQETLQNLLKGIVDYAGLFPPASLDMISAVREFARQHGSGDAWMLGRFVVPVGRLDELEQAAASHWREAGAPWGLSVLVPGDLAAASHRIDSFQKAHAGHAAVEAIERKIESPGELAPAMQAFADLEVYFEIPHQDDPSPLMAALAEHGGRAKIRSGGVTEDAFPTAAEVARFVVSAARFDVPFKATAGLHHPLRGEYRLTYEDGSPAGTMHGFLNVFLAAAWVKSSGLGEAEVEALLEERDPQAIVFGEDGVRWRDQTLDAPAIQRARRSFATSYGSCSFREPVDDLKALSLL